MTPSGSLRAPLLWLLLPFIAGLCAADAWTLPAGRSTLPLAAGLAACAVAGLASLGRADRSGPLAPALTLLSAFVAGFAWLHVRAPVAAGWPHATRGVEVVLEVGQLFPPTPERRTFSGLGRVVEARGPAAGLVGQPVYFSAIRRISVPPERSGRYRFTGLVEAVPRGAAAQGFDRHLDGLGIRARLVRGQVVAEVRPPGAFRRFCARTQDRLEQTLRRGIEDHPQPASVYAAMLLGEKALLSGEQEEAYMRTGVFHIFSISGLHVGVIAVAILSGLALLRVPPRTGRVAGLAVLWLYVQVTGASTPAERAFLMIAFVVAQKVVRLPGNPLAALAAAAFATLLWDPRQLFTTGFQMSYSVVTALLVLGLPLSDRWFAAWKPWRDLPEADWGWPRQLARWTGRQLLSALAITWAATLASTPASIGNFGLFTPGALLVNLVVVPLASLAIVAGFIAIVAGLVAAGPLAVLMNHAATVAILAMGWLVRQATGLPGMHFAAEFHAPWMGAAGLVVVLGAMALAADRRRGRAAPYWMPPAALALVLILGVKFT